MNRLLVTGTDTGVGKTLVACAIARALSERWRVAPFKPAETGCAERNGQLVPEDALRLKEASRSPADLDVVCPYRYREPVAPWLAAERAGRPIEIATLRGAFERLAAESDVVIVESAGGLLVPLTEEVSFADLARELDLPLLVVVGSRLGAINQTLLTLECAAARGLRVLGYVLNDIAPGTDLARQTNEQLLARLTRVPRLGSVPFLESTDPRRLAPIGESLVARLAVASGA